MNVKDFDLLLTCAEELLAHMKERSDHYEYTGSMNNVDRLRDFVREARLAYDTHRLARERSR